MIDLLIKILIGLIILLNIALIMVAVRALLTDYRAMEAEKHRHNRIIYIKSAMQKNQILKAGMISVRKTNKNHWYSIFRRILPFL